MIGQPSAANAQAGTSFTIRRRGEVLAQVDSLHAALTWLLANQPDSAKTAVTERGYDVRDQRGVSYFRPARRF